MRDRHLTVLEGIFGDGAAELVGWVRRLQQRAFCEGSHVLALPRHAETIRDVARQPVARHVELTQVREVAQVFGNRSRNLVVAQIHLCELREAADGVGEAAFQVALGERERDNAARTLIARHAIACAARVTAARIGFVVADAE